MAYSVRLAAVLTVFAVMAGLASANVAVEGQDCLKAAGEPAATANRPMRQRSSMILTVGQTEGDLQGKDDKIIQAGIDYLARLGGGTLRILPGVYQLRNAIHLQANITLQGSGERTVLEKHARIETPLLQDSAWFEYGVRVRDPKGFAAGDGIMLRSRTGREHGSSTCSVPRSRRSRQMFFSWTD